MTTPKPNIAEHIGGERKMANGTFTDIPGKVLFAAFVIIGVFLGVALGLYHCNFSAPPATPTANSAYFLKFADALINAAIVGVFLALLRTWFELPKWYAQWRGR